MKTKILPLATSHIAHLCNQLNDVFALLISMPRVETINFYQNKPKFKLFLQKKLHNFLALGVLLPNPSATGGKSLARTSAVVQNQALADIEFKSTT